MSCLLNNRLAYIKLHLAFLYDKGISYEHEYDDRIKSYAWTGISLGFFLRDVGQLC